MKRCPRCNRTYPDDYLNFCLDDGTVLEDHGGEEPTRSLRDEMPPTIVLDPPRVTNPIGWDAGQNIQPFHTQPSSYPQPVFQGYPMGATPNQTLAILSLCLGAGSLVVGWCCSNGLLLAPAAIVLGIVAIVQNNRDPKSYGGRGLAWGGIGAGGLFLLLYLLFIIIYGLAAIGGALSS
jgi:hypothetical protein